MSSTPDSSALNIDLWPKAKFETDLVTPASILRRQAALLGEKAQQLVTPDVFTSTSGDYVTHFFRLVVPALDNYKYELFSARHKVDQLYPFTGYSKDGVLQDQSTFVECLKGILSSESVLKKIDSLMAQAKG
jgi:hypothetical protein